MNPSERKAVQITVLESPPPSCVGLVIASYPCMISPIFYCGSRCVGGAAWRCWWQDP